MGNSPSFFQCHKPSKALFNPKLAKDSLLRIKKSVNSSSFESSRETADFPSFSTETPEKLLKSLENFAIQKKLREEKENGDSLLLMRHKTQGNDQLFVLKTVKTRDFAGVFEAEYLKFLSFLPNCPYLARIVRSFVCNGTLYLIMEHCAGGLFCEMLRKQRRFSEDVARFYAAELVLALESLDSPSNLRELRLENVLLDGDGHVKVANFGRNADCLENCVEIAGKSSALQGKRSSFQALGELVFLMVAGFQGKTQEIQEIRDNCLEKLTFPRFFSEECRDFVEKLVRKDEKNPISWKNVKKLPFFHEFPWKMLAKKLIIAPFCAGKSANSLGNLKEFRKFWSINEQLLEKPGVYLERTYFLKGNSH